MKIFEEWLAEGETYLSKEQATKLASALKSIFKKNKITYPLHGECKLVIKTREFNDSDYYIEFYLQGVEHKKLRMNLVLLRMQLKGDKLDILMLSHLHGDHIGDMTDVSFFKKMMLLKFLKRTFFHYIKSIQTLSKYILDMILCFIIKQN